MSGRLKFIKEEKKLNKLNMAIVVIIINCKKIKLLNFSPIFFVFNATKINTILLFSFL